MEQATKSERTQAERNEEIADKLEEFFNDHALDSRITPDECVLLLKAVVALRGHETSDVW